MANRKKVKRGIPSRPAKKIKSPVKLKPKKEPYIRSILDYSPVYDVPDSALAPLQTSIITTNQQQRQNGGGWLIRAGNSWRADDPRVDAQLQAAIIDLGVTIAAMKPLSVRTQSVGSTDGNYHLTWDDDPLHPGGFLITLYTPPDSDVGGGTIEGAHATTLSPGSDATASIDSSNILQVGIPRGVIGLGAAITNGTITNTSGPLTLTLDPPAEPLPTSSATITYTLNGNIPPSATGLMPQFNTPTIIAGAPGSSPTIAISGSGTSGDPYHLTITIPTGATGSSGVVSVANVDQDASLPDTLLYDASTKIVTLKRPGAPTLPAPPSTASICDIATAIADRVEAFYSDELNYISAQVAAGVNLSNMIWGLAAIVPVIGAAISYSTASLSGAFTVTAATSIADYTTAFKLEMTRLLFCEMTSAATKQYNQSINDAWATAIESDTALNSTIRQSVADMVKALDVAQIAIVGTYAPVGTADCGGLDCGGGTSYPWTLTLDFRLPSPSFVMTSHVGNIDPTLGLSTIWPVAGPPTAHVNIVSHATDTILEAYEWTCLTDTNTPTGGVLSIQNNDLGSPAPFPVFTPQSTAVQTKSQSGLSTVMFSGIGINNWRFVTNVANPDTYINLAMIVISMHGSGTPPTFS